MEHSTQNPDSAESAFSLVRSERQILDASPTGTLITRISDGTILFANRAIGKMLGIEDVSSVLGTLVPNFYGDPAERQVVLGRFRSEGSLNGYEMRARRLDDSLFWVSISLQLFEFDGEKALLSTVVDITQRKEAEQRLQESEQRLHTLFDALPQPVIVTQLSDGRVLYANQQLSLLIGIPLSQILGMQTPDFYYNPADRLRFVQTLQKEGRVRNAEIQLKRQDGAPLWAEITIEMTAYQGVPATVAIIEDIAERKKAEQAVRESEERFRLFSSATTEGLVFHEKGVIIDVNVTLVNMFGYSDASELIGKNLLSFIAPESRDAVLKQMQSVGTAPYEAFAIRKDGIIFPIEATPPSALYEYHGHQVRMASIRDITERVKAETELRRLQSAVDQTDDGIAIADMDGNMLYVNPAWAKMHGYTVEELLNKHLAMFHTAEQVQQEVLPFNAGAMEKGTNTGEVGHVRKDGSTFPTIMTSTVLKDEAGNPIGLVGTARDITENKLAEQALNASREQLSNIIDFLPDATFVIDANRKVIAWNRAIEEMTGIPKDEILGRSDYAYAIPFYGEERPILIDFALEPQKDIPDRYDALGRRETTISGEVYVPTVFKGRGAYLYATASPLYDAANNIIGAVESIRDISERKQAEQTMQESEQRFRGMAAAMVDGLAIIEGGKIVYVNDRLGEITGYSKEELTVMSSMDYAAPEEKERLAQLAAKARQNGVPMNELSYWMVRKDGQRRFLHNRYSTLTGSDNQTVGRVIVTTDETERVLLAQQAQQSLERRGYQVQLSTEISQEIATAPELITLFERVVTLIKERLGYYHTQLLRFDPTQSAVVLIAGYGEIGARMLIAGHRMPMGHGLIGVAAARAETVMRPTLANDPDWQPNPLLPETKGEIAVPIKLGQQVLGVLDVQASQAGAITDDDRLLLEGLCGQIAIAMEQTRLRQEMQERLEEINILYRTMNREGWDSFRQTADLPGGFLFDQGGLRPLAANALFDTESFASASLAVPGGVAIGTLSLSDDPERPLTPEDHNFLQQISEQVALALESARLFSQTQSTLAQTETLYAGSERIIRSGTMNEALAAVIETTPLKRFERASIMLFNRAWGSQPPETGLVVGQWTRGGSPPIVPMGAIFPIGQLPFAAFMRRDTPVFIGDVQTDPRLDPETRAMISGIGKSMAFFPLLAGDQWFGLLITAASEVINLAPDALRQVESLVGQAATVIQSIRLYEQAQAAAQRERTLREVTTQVRASIDADTILRTAVRELGQALGRETFVRMGGQPQSDTGATKAGQP
jgi:PAS domain S-box-containing protein